MPNESSRPAIRFAGFTDAWERRKLGEVADRYDNLRIPVAATLRVAGSTPYYGANGIQDYVKGFTHEGEFVLVAEDGANDLRNYPVKCVEGRIWVNNHAHVLQSKHQLCDNHFLAYSISQADIESLLVGGGRAKLNAEAMMGIEIAHPSIFEQALIGRLLDSFNSLITLHQRKYDKLVNIKKSMLEKMFPKNDETVPAVRFAGFTDAWERRKVGEVAKCIPFKDYLSSPQPCGHFPIIQQGDNPVLGYADGLAFQNYDKVVLFGDHTLSLYRPEMPFFIATDGIRILTSPSFDSCFLLFLLERIKPSSEGYKRYYSILSYKLCNIPTLNEERVKISNFLSNLDRLITLHQRKLERLQNVKKAFLEKMFA